MSLEGSGGGRARVEKAALRGWRVYIAKPRNILLTAVLRHCNRSPGSIPPLLNVSWCFFTLEAPRSHSPTLQFGGNCSPRFYRNGLLFAHLRACQSLGFGIHSYSCLHNNYGHSQVRPNRFVDTTGRKGVCSNLLSYLISWPSEAKAYNYPVSPLHWQALSHPQGEENLRVSGYWKHFPTSLLALLHLWPS